MRPGDVEALEMDSRQAVASGDPTALLMAEHNWLRSVLDEMKSKLRAAATDESAAFDSYFSEVSKQLELHIRKEEEVFFPALDPLLVEAGQGSTTDMYGEHDAIRICRDQLEAALGTGMDVSGALAAFTRSTTVHFDNEEELIFGVAPDLLTAEQALRLVLEMQALEG